MKMSVIEVRDMLSVLSVLGVEKRIGDVPGVESVTVNHAAGTAAVRYDETRLQIADIKSDMRHAGLKSTEPDTPLTAAPTSGLVANAQVAHRLKRSDVVLGLGQQVHELNHRKSRLKLHSVHRHGSPPVVVNPSFTLSGSPDEPAEVRR